MKAGISKYVLILNLEENKYLPEDLRSKLLDEIQGYVSRVSIDELADWQLLFILMFNDVKEILIYRKSKSLVKDKLKEVTIHIPIPTKDVVAWGVDKNQCLCRPISEKSRKLADILYLDPKKYSDGVSYTAEVVRMAVREVFRLGITVNGKRIVGNV